MKPAAATADPAALLYRSEAFPEDLDPAPSLSVVPAPQRQKSIRRAARSVGGSSGWTWWPGSGAVSLGSFDSSW